MLHRIVSEFTNEQSLHDSFAQDLSELLDFSQKHYVSAAATMPTKFCVAVSGGSDSLALLLLSRGWAQKNGGEIFCVTVDHQLRKESLEEAVFVQTLCESMRIEHKILAWNSQSDVVDSGKLENLAREARYRLILEFCAAESVGIVLTGHTWNDQLETFAMRESHGSSKVGLAGISRIRSLADNVKLLRPLLYFRRDCLKNFLRNRKMAWKDDPMNDDETFQRILWRKKIASYSVEKTSELSHEIMRLGKMRNAVEMKAVVFLRTFCEFLQCGHAIIQRDQFLMEERATRMEILRRVIWNVGGKKYATVINADLLAKILDGKINTLGRCLLKIKKHEILVFREIRLPCLSQNHRIERGSVDLPSGSDGFVNKMNLFDVFL
ncbi:MAG: tRNA lysidine(34) synthetase TilS [Holosporaceae bacterium]|jgi:tRNA(Ile)-lysidine synthase|nr:tRNA lysidine(34) synthetase TilS [Holosporaceae bacterium]